MLFSWQFAFMLLLILVFHEYGHLWAMKRFGLKTKGMYLIPFVGGLAIGDQAKTQWQEVVIAMMGPLFGLLMSLAAYGLYLLTDSDILGLIACYSAFINFFNLLPVYPLDGGHTIKAIALSCQRFWGLLMVLCLSLVGLKLAHHAGWHLISFIIILGLLDLLFKWRTLSEQRLRPLDRYGIIFSLTWYVSLLVACIVLMIVMMNSGVPGTAMLASILAI